jgi:hypothetical protein
VNFRVFSSDFSLFREGAGPKPDRNSAVFQPSKRAFPPASETTTAWRRALPASACGHSIASPSSCAQPVASDTSGQVSTLATAGGQGTLPGITASPSTLSFGSLSGGTASQAQTVTVSNTGSAPLTIGTASGTGEYAESDNCGTTLADGVCCTRNVTVTPATPDRPSPCWRKKATAAR